LQRAFLRWLFIYKKEKTPPKAQLETVELLCIGTYNTLVLLGENTSGSFFMEIKI
jgi:hypothetical protein